MGINRIVVFSLVLLSVFAAPPPNGAALECTGADVRCRATPCTDGRIITTFQNGAKMTSMGQERTACGYTWWQVKGTFGEGWVASNYLRQPGQPGNELCFPLKQGSFSRVSVNWGGSRQNGARCHAGIDVYSKAPGDVVAVADGTVTNIFNFLVCREGWACAGGKCPNGRQTVAVMVHHPSLGKTINYGEVDFDHVAVRSGQAIKKGQRIGRAGYCGMLHFEIYSGRQTANARWAPPAGGRAADPDKCARQYLGTKPATLEDPRPWIQNRLSGKWC
jgi:murein DD-endopeptidase MepM/ murein hydrolase activator NlpD